MNHLVEQHRIQFERARQRLAAIFDSAVADGCDIVTIVPSWREDKILLPTRALSDELQHEILDLCTMFPCLAAIRFEPVAKENMHCGGGFPLHFLVSLRAKLPVIFHLFSLYPAAVEQGGHEKTGNRLPLQAACALGGAQPGVIKFLVDAYPKALSILYESDMRHWCHFQPRLPLVHYLWSEQVNIDTLRFLVDRYPDSVKNLMTSEGYSHPLGRGPFYYIFQCQTDPQITNYLADLTRIVAPEHFFFQEDLTLDLARTMSRMFPVLNDVEISPGSVPGGEATWRFLLSVLEHNESITNLNLGFSDGPSQATVESIRHLLATNKTISKMTLINYDEETPFPVFGTLNSARLQLPVSLKHFDFQRFSIYPRDFVDLLTKQPSLEELQFFEMNILSGDTPCDCYGDSGIKRITIECPHIQLFSSVIAKMPNLEAVCIRYGEGDIDVTACILSLLRNGVIRRLTIDGALVVDMESLCEEMKKNTSLAIFRKPDIFDNETNCAMLAEVVATENVTLEYIEGDQEHNCPHFQKLKYYTRLNRFGRRKCRDPTTSLRELVELLCAVVEGADCDSVADMGSDYPELEPSPLNPMDAFNVQYGLLRESPAFGPKNKIHVQ